MGVGGLLTVFTNSGLPNRMLGITLQQTNISNASSHFMLQKPEPRTSTDEPPGSFNTNGLHVALGWGALILSPVVRKGLR